MAKVTITLSDIGNRDDQVHVDVNFQPLLPEGVDDVHFTPAQKTAHLMLEALAMDVRQRQADLKVVDTKHS